MTSLEELSAQALARDGAAPAVEFQGRWIDWGALRHVAERVGTLIDASGVSPDTTVALVPRNRPSAVAALLGLIARGHTIRMIYAYQSCASLAREVERIQPAVIVAAEEDFGAELVDVLRAKGAVGIGLREMDATAVARLARVGAARASGAATSDPGAVPTSGADGVSGTAPTLGTAPASRAAPTGAPRRIELLTSGTTGPPKAFAITFDLIAKFFVATNPTQANKNLEGNGGAAGAPPFLLFMPLGNISGIYSTLPVLLRGQRGILLERFTVEAWHDYILRFRPSLSGLPPAGVQMVLDANIPREDLAGIRSISTGAAALDPSTQRAFEERYGIPILLSYGATEFAGPVTAMTADLYAEWGQKKFGSVGRAMPGAKLRVVDPDTGALLPPGQEGLLEVISPRMGPEWIRTSDIVVIDEDGFMFHRGRADGAIMRGGFKLLPETIERALLLHDSIAAAGVSGVHDQRLGQVPAAAIQVKVGVERPSVDELEAHVRKHVYSTHVPVKWRFVDELPRTPSLKVDRRALQALLEN